MRGQANGRETKQMLLGQILFLLAALAIAGATLVGIVLGLGKVVLYALTGKSMGPKPAMGSSDWQKSQSGTTVDLARRSLLTERYGHTTDDPVVELDGDHYRVTRMAGGRFLITQVDEGRRVGTFELSGDGRHQDVIPSPDDPANTQLLVHVAVLSSFVRRDAGRIARDHDHHGRHGHHVHDDHQDHGHH